MSRLPEQVPDLHLLTVTTVGGRPVTDIDETELAAFLFCGAGVMGRWCLDALSGLVAQY
jgi:hypothetical protein